MNVLTYVKYVEDKSIWAVSDPSLEEKVDEKWPSSTEITMGTKPQHNVLSEPETVKVKTTRTMGQLKFSMAQCRTGGKKPVDCSDNFIKKQSNGCMQRSSRTPYDSIRDLPMTYPLAHFEPLGLSERSIEVHSAENRQNNPKTNKERE